MLVKSAAPLIIIPSLPSTEGKTAFLAIGNLLFRGGFCRGERPGRMETGREAMSRQRRSSRRVRKASPASRSMIRNCSRSLEIVRFWLVFLEYLSCFFSSRAEMCSSASPAQAAARFPSLRWTVLQGNIRTVDGNQAHARIGGCVRVLRMDLRDSIRKFSHILGIQVVPRLGKRLPAHRIFLGKIIGQCHDFVEIKE